MKVSPDALRVLELEKWNDQVARRAKSDAGRAAARAATPAATFAQASRLLSETRAALAMLLDQQLPEIRVEKDGVDLLDVARTAGRPLLAGELAVLLRFLRQGRDLRSALRALDDPDNALFRIGVEMPEFGPYVDALEAAVDEGGSVLDAATERLRELRFQIADLKEDVRHRVERYAQRPDVRTLLRGIHPSIRDGRLVLPVRAEARGQLKGLYHDRSATGATVYVEPEAVVEAQNTLRELYSIHGVPISTSPAGGRNTPAPWVARPWRRARCAGPIITTRPPRPRAGASAA